MPRYFNTLSARTCEGLFRVPGNQRLVDTLWDYMQSHPYVRLSTNSVIVFVRKHPKFTATEVSSFLKRFIGFMLPTESLVTYNCYDPLVDLIKQKCPEHVIGEKCKRIIRQLVVPARRKLLGRLCTFFLDFSRHQAVTRMNCQALAVCSGYLMHAPPKAPKRSRRRCSSSNPLLLTKRRRWRKEAAVKRSNSDDIEDLQKMSHTQLRDYIVAKAEKSKLIALVIEALIKHAQHIFSS